MMSRAAGQRQGRFRLSGKIVEPRRHVAGCGKHLRRWPVKIVPVALMTLALLPAAVSGADLAPARVSTQAKPNGEGKPSKAAARTVTVHATVTAIDKEKQT